MKTTKLSVAVIGSRDFEDFTQLAEVLDALRPSAIISGGAKGADTLAERYASDRGLPLTVIRPDWKLGRAAGPIRNGKIVAAADHVVAFWDGKSPGTRDTIKKATALQKPCDVYNFPAIAPEA